MASVNNSVAVVDDRPYFEKAVRFGLAQGILTRETMARIEADAPKGIVQIADHFGTAYLRTDLESAVARMSNLISLYLEDFSNGDLRAAAMSLRDNTLLSHSRGGSEMLKRLHAMPGDTSLHARSVDEQCQANQMRIDFARWLARQLNTKPGECEDYSAEEVIRSAMLLLYVGAKTLEMPSKREFVQLIEALRKKTFKHKPATLDAFLRDAPSAFQEMTRQAMQDFIDDALPRLKSPEKSADEILHAEAQGAFFVRDLPEEDVVAYDRLVAKEWVRITKGNADDPDVLATIFLNVATGHPPKAAALLKEAKSIIAAFRTRGFDSKAVLAFIDEHAPFEQREDLKLMWTQDLQPDAEIHLADNDPQMPDSHMDRALQYFRQNCVANWKGSR